MLESDAQAMAEQEEPSRGLPPLSRLVGNPNVDPNAEDYHCINLYVAQPAPGLLQDASLFAETIDARILVDNHNHTAMAEDMAKKVSNTKVDFYLEDTASNGEGRFFQFDHPMKENYWFMPNWENTLDKELEKASLVIARFYQVFQNAIEYRDAHGLDYDVIYTKFSSHDRYDPSIEKNYDEVLHLAGKSPFKNTGVVLDLWKAHPEYPKLTIVCHEGLEYGYSKFEAHYNSLLPLPNVEFISRVLEKEEINELENRCGIHLCASKMEGYGHYLNEARSAEAAIITGDVAPTDELIEDGYNGLVIGTQTRKDNPLSTEKLDLTQQELEKGMNRMLSMSIEERRQLGKNARKSYLADTEHFKRTMGKLGKHVCGE
jgi:glycosyltransferase involved in cell wall biosynthesis